jgi:hypothetical protein
LAEQFSGDAKPGKGESHGSAMKATLSSAMANAVSALCKTDYSVKQIIAVCDQTGPAGEPQNSTALAQRQNAPN